MYNVGSDGLGIEGPVQEFGCNSSKSLQPEEWHESNLVLENPKGLCRKPGSQEARQRSQLPKEELLRTWTSAEALEIRRKGHI